MLSFSQNCDIVLLVNNMKVYHLTTKENLYSENGIIKQGLLPQCGNRAKMIKDNRVGIFFTNNFNTLPIWTNYLYPYAKFDDLCVLTFDIEKKDCIPTENRTEFYTTNQIVPEKISVATFFNQKTHEEIPFYLLGAQAYNDYGWGEKPEPISVYVIREPITNLINCNKHK